MPRSAATTVFNRCVWAALAVAFSSLLTNGIRAQDEKNLPRPLQEAVIAKLAPLTYPPLARQTRTSGDVELKLEVRPDGSVASAVAIGGHPLLVPAALENAQKSQFACEHCGEEAHFFRLVYTFGLDQPTDENEKSQQLTNNPDHPNLRVTQSTGHVFVTDHTVCLCDPGPDPIKVRSVKCLYLWKCKRVV